MEMSSGISPSRSWRVALVAGCLLGTTIVCITLAGEVRRANAALETTTSQTLRDYATTAGRVLGTEAIRQSNDFRAQLFGPSLGTNVIAGDAPGIEAFAHRSDSIFAAERYAPDSLRGYLRINARTRTWEAAGATRDSAFAAAVIDTLFSPSRASTLALLTRFPGRQVSVLVARAAVADQSGHQFIYVVTQSRVTNLQHAVREAMETVPLLPPSFTGAAWNMDEPASPANRQFNYSLLGVRIIAADGTVLYTSPRWFGGPYQGSYRLQSGAARFTVQTSILPAIKSRLVPAAVVSARKSLYIGLVLVGGFLIAVSFLAFQQEMSYQRGERARSMEQLTTGLRHELNNSLASVMLEAQLLAASEDASPDSRYAGAAIAEQAERMRNVLRKLDNVDHLPLVAYFEGRSMVDLTTDHPAVAASRTDARAS